MISWTKAQKHELEWWTNNNVDPRKAWRYYDLHFIGELQDRFEIAIDFGSGPVSYLHNHNVQSIRSVAIDSLAEDYSAIQKFHKFKGPKHVTYKNGFTSWIREVDAFFLLNMLDHVEDPIKMIKGATELLCSGGKLFIFCDLDKKTDIMHPQRLPIEWFHAHVFEHFYPLVFDVEPSWKFSNDVLYYCGRKK